MKQKPKFNVVSFPRISQKMQLNQELRTSIGAIAGRKADPREESLKNRLRSRITLATTSMERKMKDEKEARSVSKVR